MVNAVKKNHTTGDLLCAIILFIFPVIAFIRLYPFTESLDEIINGTKDDWRLYALTALDIKDNGWLIHSQGGNYDYPNGFLYSYLLAFLFGLLGEDPARIYIFQSFMLGLSVVIMYKTFSDKMEKPAGIIFLLLLFTFALLDIHRHYTFRFLSENLVILTLSAFFYFLIRGLENKKDAYWVFSGVFLALSMLTRPNLLPICVLTLMLFLTLSLKKTINYKHVGLFVLGFILQGSFLALRNLKVSGELVFFPVNSFSFFSKYVSHPDATLMHVWQKFLFCVGYLPAAEPNYQWRPHWTLIWLVYFIYLFLRWKDKRTLEIWEMVIHLFILANFFILVFVIDINLLICYGFRYNLAMNLAVLIFTAGGIEKIRKVFSQQTSSLQ